MVFLASCGKGQPPLVPVEGQVFLDKRPAHGAIVWFHPVDPVEPGAPRPRGMVNADGDFSLGTHKTGDGVPPGKYRVSIYWRAPVKSGDESGDPLIPERYSDPLQSGLPVVEVQHDPVTLPAFFLTSN